MGRANKKEKEIKGAWYYVACTTAALGPLIIFIINVFTNVWDTVFPKEETLFIGISVLVVGFLCWMLVSAIMSIISKKGNDKRKNGISKWMEKTNLDDVRCEKNETILCPLRIGINKYGWTRKNYDSISEEKRLYEKGYVYDNIEPKDKWKEIWIFSWDLSSEIDGKTGGAESVLISNTAKKKKYTIFYLNIKSKEKEIIRNHDDLVDSLSTVGKKHVSFIPIDVKSGNIGQQTLPLLCGSILFSSKNGNDGLPDFSEGYLSIRKDKDDTPIYYKMPRCMLQQYADFFKDIQKNNRKVS